MTARYSSRSRSPRWAKNISARCLSARRMNAEISGGVSCRSPRPIRTTPPPVAGDLERKQPRLIGDVVDALPHEPLDGVHGPAGVGQKPRLRVAADVDPALSRDGHDRRHQGVAVPVGNHEGAGRPSPRRRGCWWCRDRCRWLCSCVCFADRARLSGRLHGRVVSGRAGGSPQMAQPGSRNVTVGLAGASKRRAAECTSGQLDRVA